MAIIVKNIVPRKYAENAQTTQYTAVNCKTVIDKFTITNVSATTATISINLVLSGNTPSSLDLVLKLKAIQPNETYQATELVGQSLESGGFISLVASAGSALVVSATGREIT
jgi:hypothetical protein